MLIQVMKTIVEFWQLSNQIYVVRLNIKTNTYLSKVIFFQTRFVDVHIIPPNVYYDILQH